MFMLALAVMAMSHHPVIMRSAMVIEADVVCPSTQNTAGPGETPMTLDHVKAWVRGRKVVDYQTEPPNRFALDDLERETGRPIGTALRRKGVSADSVFIKWAEKALSDIRKSQRLQRSVIGTSRVGGVLCRIVKVKMTTVNAAPEDSSMMAIQWEPVDPAINGALHLLQSYVYTVPAGGGPPVLHTAWRTFNIRIARGRMR